MKVVVKSYTDNAIENNDYRDAMEIHIDGDPCFGVSDGEPEDANLNRDFNDCWTIPELMERAYEAGKRGEEFEIEYLKVNEF